MGIGGLMGALVNSSDTCGCVQYYMLLRVTLTLKSGDFKINTGQV